MAYIEFFFFFDKSILNSDTSQKKKVLQLLIREMQANKIPSLDVPLLHPPSVAGNIYIGVSTYITHPERERWACLNNFIEKGS